MKRERETEAAPAASGHHPDENKPLSAFRTITAVCNDCGHVTVLDRDRLDALAAVPSFGVLWRHAFCQPCRDAGVADSHRNVTLHGERLDKGEPPPVAWSDKPLFTNERADLMPHLPRRSLFDRR